MNSTNTAPVQPNLLGALDKFNWASEETSLVKNIHANLNYASLLLWQENEKYLTDLESHVHRVQTQVQNALEGKIEWNFVTIVSIS